MLQDGKLKKEIRYLRFLKFAYKFNIIFLPKKH